MLETLPFPEDVKTAVGEINGGTDPLDIAKLTTGMTSLKAALAANAHLKGTDDSNIAYVKQWEATLKYLNEDFKKAAKGSVDTFVAGLQTLQNATAPATAPVGPPGPTPEQLQQAYETAKVAILGDGGSRNAIDLDGTDEDELERLINAADAAYQPLNQPSPDAALDDARTKLTEKRRATYDAAKGAIPAELTAVDKAALEPVMEKVVKAYKKLNPDTDPSTEGDLSTAFAKLQELGSTCCGLA
jgi:hypothetical protein